MKRFLFFCFYFFAFFLGTHCFAQYIPQRIVSLSPAATEILFAVGAQNQIAARTDFCDFPQEAAKIPSIGGFDGKTFSLESILKLNPDFVYATEGMHNHLILPLEKLGIRVFVSNAATVAKVIDEIRTIGIITGNAQKAESVALMITHKLEKTAQKSAVRNTKKVYWEVWNSPYMSVGKNSFINDVIEKSGGKNIFAKTDSAYPMVSEESIIALNPDIIFIADDSPVQTSDIAKRTGWKLTNAVKNGAIYKIDANLFSRPGPRIADAIEKLSQLLD